MSLAAAAAAEGQTVRAAAGVGAVTAASLAWAEVEG